MNYETDKSSVYHYTMSFLTRRFVFAFTIAICKVNIVLQIYLSIFGSLALISYLLYWNPMEADHYDFLCIFNECVLYICIAVSLLFTEFVPEPETRYMFGNYFLYMLYINLGLNMLLLGYEITRQILKFIKRRMHWSKLRKLRDIANKERMEEQNKRKNKRNR